MATLRSPRVGAAALIMRNGRLLLIRRRGSHGEGTWSTPGGHLDYGESPEACAAREAFEETGVTIAGLRFRGVTNDFFEAEGRHYITIWFEGQYVSGEPGINAPDELDEIGWFAPEALPSPLFLPLANLFGGRSYPPLPDSRV